MSTETQVGVPATEFSPQEIASLRERKEAVEAQWIATAREQMATAEDGKATLTAEVSTEAQEKIARLQGEWQSLHDTLKMQERAKEQAAYIAADEELTRNAPKARDRKAKAAAQFYKDIIAVGHGGKYTNPEPNKERGINPGSLDLGLPAIARNPVTGRNEVMPFPAIFAGDGADQDANLVAAFRNAEMVAADKAGQYDPVTGQKRSVVHADQSLANYDQLTQGGMLHLYEIQMNELAQYMDVKQTPYINNYLVDRRTTILNAQLLNEAGTINVRDSSFNTVNISPRKFGLQKRMSYESAMTQEPWAMSNVLMMDGGIGLGNGIGEQIVVGDNTGSGMSQEFDGIDKFINDNTANQFALPAAAGFLPASGTNNFGINAMSRFCGSLPKEYFRKPNKKMVMRLSMWTRLQGAVDGENRKLFDSNSSLGDLQLPDFNVSVILDENVDVGTAAGQNAIYYGDLMSFCLVYFGPTRVDFSPYEAWSADQLSWRFIAHRGFANIDPNGIRGGRVA